MPTRRSLLLLLAAYLALGLLYDQSTPTFESSDEAWHYGMVRELAEGRGLPVQRVGVLTPYRQEGSQPPIYYLIGAVLTGGIDITDFEQRFVYNPFGQAGVPGTPVNANLMRRSAIEAFPWTGVTLAVHVLRWFSLLLGLGTIVLSFRIAQLLFPRRAALALLAAAFVAFNPMFLFINAAVNNDNALWLISSLAIYLVLRVVRGTPPPFLPWTLGVVLAVAIMIKLSGLVLAPVIALLLLWRAWRTGDWREFIRHGVIITLCVGVIAGWWFVRNLILYDEFLGVGMMRAIVGVERPRPATVLELMGEVQGWWFSLWGVFGAFSVLPGQWVYHVYSALTLLAVAGGVRALLQRKLRRRLAEYMPHVFAFVFLGLTLVGIIYWTATQYASQGRLVLGAIGIMGAFLAAGLLALVGSRFEQTAATIGALGLFGIALGIPFKYIVPIYQPPPTVSETELPPDLVPVRATLNAEIELLGYTARGEPYAPGDVLAVTLYWRGLQSMDTDYNLALNLHGRSLAPIGKLDTWPGGGLLPTAEWTRGVIYADSYPLPISPTASAPTLLRLDVSFWEDELANRLPISAPDGSPLPSLMLDVGRLTTHAEAVAEPQYPDGSTLAEGITLLGYDLAAEAVAGTALPVALYWQAGEAIAADYTVFIHLQNEAGETVAQVDGPPLGGDWPTSAWLADQVVIDSHVLPIPAALPVGRYRLSLGLYQPDTGARLEAYRANGEPWRDRAIRPDIRIDILAKPASPRNAAGSSHPAQRARDCSPSANPSITPWKTKARPIPFS